jgi:glycerol-3-phosphate dehydrogenase
MKRASLEALCEDPFDVLVVGGGIYGLMAARDAALRGLRTAVVERADFGGATSHNSLKLMHGGIRYVQHLDFARLRASVRERAFWQRAAPSLVRPLEFAIPLFGHGVKGPEAFAAAALIYNAVSAGLRGPSYSGARAVGATEARRRLGDFAPEGVTGAGVWRDGQIQDVNCLHMACLRASVEAGALAANYMEVAALTTEGGRVTGARITDQINGSEGILRARVTLSCTGAAAAQLAAPHLGDLTAFPNFARATNLVVNRQIGPLGLGVVSRLQSDAVVNRGGRMYFLTPWMGRTIIGTHEAPGQDIPRDEADVDDFLIELAQACPSLSLSKKDVIWVHQGLIPADTDDSRGTIQRQNRGTLLDHSIQGLGGLISVVGVKYTTARLIAERAVDQAATQLDRPIPRSQSLSTRLPVTDEVTPTLNNATDIAARIRNAIENEMATSLEDVTVRRTPWAETGILADAATLAHAADLVGHSDRAPTFPLRTAKADGTKVPNTKPN